MRAFDDEFVPAVPTAGDRSLSGLIPDRPLDPPEAVHRGRFTFSFVLVYLFPLLLAAGLFDLIAGERESGTLALAAAQAVHVPRWLAVKLVARAGPIWAAGLLVPLGAVLVATEHAGESVAWGRLCLWIVTIGAYLAFWTAVALWASGYAQSSAQSAVVVAAAYLLVVVAVPAAADLAAHILAPLRSRAAIADRERQVRFAALAPISGAQRQLDAAVRARFPYTVGDEQAQARSQQAVWQTPAVLPRGVIVDAYLSRYGDVSHPAYVMQLRQILHRARGEYIEAQMAPLIREFDRQRRRQRSIVHVAAWVSPALGAAIALDELAGVSGTRRERYLAQLDAYVRAWYEAIYGLIRRNQAVAPDLLRAQAPFVFVEEPTRAVAARVFPILLGLLGAAVAAGAAAVTTARHVGVAD
jgi:ABC-2 type transport system permease protein